MQKIIEQLEQGFQIIHINDFEKSYDPSDSDKAEYAENHLLIYSEVTFEVDTYSYHA